MAESFAPGGRLNLAPVASLWREPYFGRALWFTCWQAVLSTALTLALGMPAAFVFARYRFPGKSLIRALTTIPFVMPAMVVAAAFTVLLGPRGWLNSQLMAWLDLSRAPIRLQQTIWLILLAHAFYNTTVVVRMVGGFWANLDTQALRGGAGAGREPAARVPGGDVAAAAARGGRGGAAGVPLLLHQLRRDPDPGRPAFRDAGGGDLSPGGDALPAARGGRAQPGADRPDLRGHGDLHPRSGARSAAAEPAPRRCHCRAADHRAEHRRGGPGDARIAGPAGRTHDRAGRPVGGGRRSLALLPGVVRQPHQFDLLRVAGDRHPQQPGLRDPHDPHGVADRHSDGYLAGTRPAKVDARCWMPLCCCRWAPLR